MGFAFALLIPKSAAGGIHAVAIFERVAFRHQNQRHNGNMRVPLVEFFDQKPEQLGHMSRPESADPLPKDSPLSKIHVGALLFD
jgi:hypothetical protein